jgi:riboflavin kinase/FMN adenylyltransferase
MSFCSERQVPCGIVHPLVLDGAMVSSSKVRQALQVGDVGRARNLLGRPYRVAGVVGRGQQRGRTIGFPTANMEQIATLIPRDGVYAVQATIPGLAGADARFAGAANIGPNPTFGEAARKVEVHLLGFAGELLGQRLEIDFLERLRDTRRFDSAAALVEQIQRDVQQVEAVLAKENIHE